METRPNVQSNRKTLHGVRPQETRIGPSMSKVRSPLLVATERSDFSMLSSVVVHISHSM